MTIRRAELRDASHLALLDQASRREHWPLTTYQNELQAQFAEAMPGRRRQAWVALRDGLLVGFAWFSLVLDTAELENIVVSEPARRGGIARYLLVHALAALREQGIKVVQLEVRARNLAALTLYRSLGFHDDGVRKRYYGDDDAVLLSFSLTR